MPSMLRPGACRHVRRFLRSERGNFATLTALTMPVAIIATALAVDEGALYLERRELQSVTDLAAIAAAGDIANAETTAMSVLSDNGFFGFALAGSGRLDGDEETPEGGQADEIVVETGTYRPDPALPPEQRFLAGGQPANAVRVRTGRTGSSYFASFFAEAPWMSTSAVATAEAEAAFSIGSRLARLDGGIANALLGGLTGSTLSLSVMDYEALINADVSLFGFLDALATELDLTAVTYDRLLESEVDGALIAGTLADMDGVSVRAAAAARRIASGWRGKVTSARPGHDCPASIPRCRRRSA